MNVELTISSHKIMIFVLFLSSFFGEGGSAKHILVVLHRTTVLMRSKEHTQSTNKSKMKKNYENIIKYLKINTHPVLLFSLFKPVTHLI